MNIAQQCARWHLAPGLQGAFQPPISCWHRNAKLAVHAFSSPCSPGSPAHCMPMWSQPRGRVGRSDASSGWKLSNNSEFQSCCGGLLYKVPITVKHTCAFSLDFYVYLISKWIYKVDLESELFPINVNTRLCDKHCSISSKVTQKLGWCLYNFITISMTGSGVKVASQTVKSIKLGWYLATLLPRSGSTSCLTCEKRGTWLPTSQLETHQPIKKSTNWDFIYDG